jgi:hypothetical protein
MKSKEKGTFDSASTVDHTRPKKLGRLDVDPSYALKTKNRMSRAGKLLKRTSSLRDAFLLKEIIDTRL